MLIKHKPKKTWKPCKPVIIKNIEPEIPSFIPKTSSLYSINWAKINNEPKNIVKNTLTTKLTSSLSKKAIIEIFIVPDEVKSKTVKGNATEIDDNTGIFAPGQIIPKNSGKTHIEL